MLRALSVSSLRLAITVDPEIRALRRLYYCGEWIESHSLHVHLLAAPDFFGCESAIRVGDSNE